MSKKAKIAVQMMIFRQQIIEHGPYAVVKKLSEIGFNSGEVSQVEMSAENVAQLKKAGEDFNFQYCALSASLEAMMPGQESLTTHFDKIVNDCKTLNCSYLRIGMLPFNYLGSKEKTLEFAHKCDEVAGRLAEHGIKLYYHNHHIEFIKYDGKYLLDIIRDETKHIGFEIDVHWAQRGGVVPQEFIKGYKGKLELLHLKDYKIVNPDFEGVDLRDMKTFFARFNDVVRFAEVGTGSLNFPAIIEAGVETGAHFLIIEQDDTYGRDPYESLSISRDNLIQMGYKDWF